MLKDAKKFYLILHCWINSILLPQLKLGTLIFTMQSQVHDRKSPFGLICD